MPDVTGKKLDVAKGAIEDAGIDPDVEVDGGGAFGVMVESNWRVCKQSPVAGAPVSGAPRLSVTRDCDDGTSPKPAAARTTPATTGEQRAEGVLSPANNKEFGALMSADSCDESIAAFATKYAERTIKFDGSIVNTAPHGDYRTRSDILIAPGDKGPRSTKGPAFKLSDVGRYELHFTGANAPDGIAQGDRLRLTASVEEYNADQCLLYLKPVATAAR